MAEQQSSTTKSGRSLSRFVAGRDKSFAIEETLTLVPGSQTFVVRARSADSDSGEGRVTLNYQPRLPRLIDREFNPERPVLFEIEDPAQVTVSANLARPDDLHPVKGEVLIDSGEAARLHGLARGNQNERRGPDRDASDRQGAPLPRRESYPNSDDSMNGEPSGPVQTMWCPFAGPHESSRSRPRQRPSKPQQLSRLR